MGPSHVRHPDRRRQSHLLLLLAPSAAFGLISCSLADGTGVSPVLQPCTVAGGVRREARACCTLLFEVLVNISEQSLTPLLEDEAARYLEHAPVLLCGVSSWPSSKLPRMLWCGKVASRLRKHKYISLSPGFGVQKLPLLPAEYPSGPEWPA